MQIKYIFFSKRLGFRNWEAEDAHLYWNLSSDPDVMKFFPAEFWLDEETAKASILIFQDHFEKHGFTYFAVDDLDTGEFIGFIGLKHLKHPITFNPTVDIGWRLNKEFWGKGMATEGAIACIDWFNRRFNHEKIISMTPKLNLPSENVMKKIGMRKVGEFGHPSVDRKDPLFMHQLYELKLK